MPKRQPIPKRWINEFKKRGLRFVSDLVVRSADREALAKSWKRARKSHSDDQDSETQKILAALESGNTPALKVKNVKFKGGAQKGLFAATSIKKGSVIGFYTGKLLKEDEVDVDSDYVFGFGEPAYKKWLIDGQRVGNYMRFANHSKKGNMEVVELYYDGLPRIAFIALRHIKEGEQLLYDYGDEYWENKGIIPDKSL